MVDGFGPHVESQMEFVFAGIVLLALILVDILAMRYGVDSRELDKTLQPGAQRANI